MQLFEHPEFEQAMVRAAQQSGVNEQFVEKDFFVTEILRNVADRLGDKAMFKGGTSLSKGWALISRFSEDIDLSVNPDRFDPRTGKNKVDRILRGAVGNGCRGSRADMAGGRRPDDRRARPRGLLRL